MYRVLFVTDDWGHKEPLRSDLLEHDVSLTVVSSAEVLKDDFAPATVDVVVADLEDVQAEPGKLCRTLTRERVLKDHPLVLLVTEEQLSRLDVSWHFDDYLTLPVSAQRLAQRFEFLLWKLHGVDLKHGLRIGDLVINVERYEVRVKGKLVTLTYKEFELLKFLAMQPGKVFTREALLDKVWGYDYIGGTRTVDVHIRRLRSKIEVGGASYIETLRNVGYKFVGSANE